MDRRPRPSPGSASLPEPDRTRPELKTADRDRQRGTYSYHRLDDRVCGPAFVGGAALGNVQVDLKWNFRLSQWGCIGGDRPAGILYLDIGLHQQADYKLVSITVEVTLEDIPTEEDDGDGISNPHREIPVQMTDWFGPKHVVGREHVQNFTHESKFQPTSFEGPRIGIGDMGKSSQLESLLRSRWGFDGRLKRPNRTKARSAGGTHYKTLQWTVSENELESARNNTIHVAFTFEHGGQPFHIYAKVEGTLRSKRDCSLTGLRHLRFGPRRDRPGDVSTTYIGTYSGYRMPLDELAKGPDLAMQERNWRSKPSEIPAPQHATFEDTQPSPRAFSATGSPAVEQERECMVSTPGSEIQDVLERLAMAGQRFTAASTAEKVQNDYPSIPSMFPAPGPSDTASQPPSEVFPLSRPSAISVVSRMSSVTLVDHADQAAAIGRLPTVPKRPSPPPVSRMAMLQPKEHKSLFRVARAWVVAMIRLYLFFVVGIPLRFLRLGIGIVAAAVRLVGAIERRVSQMLAKHARI